MRWKQAPSLVAETAPSATSFSALTREGPRGPPLLPGDPGSAGQEANEVLFKATFPSVENQEPCLGEGGIGGNAQLA